MEEYTFGTLDFGQSQSTRGLGVDNHVAVTSTLPRPKGGRQAMDQAHWGTSSNPFDPPSAALNGDSPHLPSPGYRHGAHLRQQLHADQAGDETLSTEQGTDMGGATRHHRHHPVRAQPVTLNRMADSWVDHDSYAPGQARSAPKASIRLEHGRNVNHRQPAALSAQSLHPSPGVEARYAQGARGAYAHPPRAASSSSSSLNSASEDEDEEEEVSGAATPETKSTGNHVDLRATPVGQSRTVKHFTRPTLGEDKLAALKAAEQQNFRYRQKPEQERYAAQVQEDKQEVVSVTLLLCSRLSFVWC